MKLIRSALLLLCIFGAYAVHLENQQTAKAWTAIGEHDSSCFIEGISFLNDTHVLESCGLYGSSYFHIMQYDRELTSLHETYRSALFPSSIFAEGSILFPPNNIIYMLTYQEGIVYRFNATDFSQILPHLRWDHGQGWSLTHNNTHIFVNNGSNLIFVVDAQFNVLEIKPIVKQNGQPMRMINQMEWVHESDGDYIYSNVWLTNLILKINLSTNQVEKTFDATKLVNNTKDSPGGSRIDVLNGIAYDHLTDTFLLTGKKWPLFYVSKLDHP